MVCCSCGLEAVIRTSWTNQNHGHRLYGCSTLENLVSIKTRAEEPKRFRMDDMIKVIEMGREVQVDNCFVKPIRIIPCPASIVQTVKLHKIIDTRKGGDESVMSTQEFRKVIEDVGKDEDFMRASWLSVFEYVNVDGGIVTGCFGDVKKFLKNGKFKKVVAIIKSCTPNALGDLTVTLKDLSGTISGTIHYKVLTEE
ncbi:hypothetical protein Tco_0985655, partial [Tanacetum coccineum]